MTSGKALESHQNEVESQNKMMMMNPYQIEANPKIRHRLPVMAKAGPSLVRRRVRLLLCPNRILDNKFMKPNSKSTWPTRSDNKIRSIRSVQLSQTLLIFTPKDLARLRNSARDSKMSLTLLRLASLANLMKKI